MNRDGRGRPGRIVLKNQPQLRLEDVLRRRRSNLEALMGQLGLTTYVGLQIWCDRMGIVPPTREGFAAKYADRHPPVNSPQEGVVVLEPPPVISESTGSPVEVADPVSLPGLPAPETPSEPPMRRPRRTSVIPPA